MSGGSGDSIAAMRIHSPKPMKRRRRGCRDLVTRVEVGTRATASEATVLKTEESDTARWYDVAPKGSVL